MDIDEESAFNEQLASTAQAGPSTQIPGAGVDRPAGMSKNAMKKAAKQAKLEALKPAKRAAERERRRIRSAQLSAGYAAGTLSAEDKEIFERRRKVERERKAAQKRLESGEAAAQMWKGGVVIDLGFDELMNDQEIASMQQQLGYLYSTNRTALRPFSTLLHTTFSPSVSPRLWERMAKSSWERWSSCYWWAEGLDVLTQQIKSAPSSTSDPSHEIASHSASTALDTNVHDTEKYLTGPTLPPAIKSGKHKLVYLSADAEEELDVLSEDEVYIIGGIVDRNRYKDKAEKLEIRTARLPIGKYLENLPTRKVLTVNQVFDILVKWIELQDWAQAFEAVIPQRKFHTGRKEMRAAKFADKGDASDQKEDLESDEDDSRAKAPINATDDTDEIGVDEEAAMNA